MKPNVEKVLAELRTDVSEGVCDTMHYLRVAGQASQLNGTAKDVHDKQSLYRAVESVDVNKIPKVYFDMARYLTQPKEVQPLRQIREVNPVCAVA